MYKISCLLAVVFYLGAAFTYNDADPITPCINDYAVSDIVLGQNATIQVARLITSAQTIAQNSNMIYKSGSGSVLSYGNTGLLTGPSVGFQVYPGSTLTIEIEDCYTPQN